MLLNGHYPKPTVILIGQKKNDLYICNVLPGDLTVGNVAIYSIISIIRAIYDCMQMSVAITEDVVYDKIHNVL